MVRTCVPSTRTLSAELLTLQDQPSTTAPPPALYESSAATTQQPLAQPGMSLGGGNRNAKNVPFNASGERDWSFGLFECFEDPMTCASPPCFKRLRLTERALQACSRGSSRARFMVRTRPGCRRSRRRYAIFSRPRIVALTALAGHASRAGRRARRRGHSHMCAQLLPRFPPAHPSQTRR